MSEAIEQARQDLAARREAVHACAVEVIGKVVHIVPDKVAIARAALAAGALVATEPPGLVYLTWRQRAGAFAALRTALRVPSATRTGRNGEVLARMACEMAAEAALDAIVAKPGPTRDAASLAIQQGHIASLQAKIDSAKEYADSACTAHRAETRRPPARVA